ncbi:MAG TPA: ATP-dependent helicase [Pyrinomonadaceae bacterium]|nr:ATP-dependent helicase [Pyrinomonadaceae bacterium]
MPITVQQQNAESAKQREAAHRAEPQVSLVAGPGTGKSSTIEERVRWLLESGVGPTAIRVVSFTRASARDLQSRVRAYCAAHSQHGSEAVSITTLHSLALRLLRLGGLLQLYPADPLILDDWELEQVYDGEFGEACDISSKVRREEIRRYYEAVWSTGAPNAPTYLPPENPITSQEKAKFDSFHSPTAQVYSCVLPGEIVRKCVDGILTGTLDARQLLRIDHLIVDEYQDLNPADLQFVDQVTAQGVNVFVAGDDDQSIYSFRHASPSGIQTFPQRFVNSVRRVLDACFRCTPAVLSAASSLIGNNAPPGRIPKSLTSLYAASDPPNPGIVHRWAVGNAFVEGNAIGQSCDSLIRAGLSPKDILILLATSDARVQLWAPIRQSLESLELAFEPPKDQGFIETAAGRLVLAVLRIISSRDDAGIPQDFVAHRVLLGSKSRVGITTCNSIRALVLTTANLSFRDLFYQPTLSVSLNGRQRTAIEHARGICTLIGPWSPEDTLANRRDEIGTVVEQTIGVEARDTWLSYGGALPDTLNLAELRDYLWADTDEQRAIILGSVNSRLGRPEESIEAFPRKIRVMTMHGAKGLSAKVVFIPGLEQGILPNRHQTPYPAQVLEAARLLYVSITRAKACCILSYATHRLVSGQSRDQTPSAFASQTGGRFNWRQNGFAPAEVEAIVESVSLL